MYSLTTRANIILYNFLFGAGGFGLLNYLMAFYGPHEIKSPSFEVTEIDTFIND